MSARQSYPSPGPPNQSAPHPFYQSIGNAHTGHDADQDDGRAEYEGGVSEASEHDGEQQQSVPDDPALRSHLANMMGNFGGTPAVPYAQRVTGGPPLPASYENASASKHARTKVSRACDNCRRKKIRCDAPDESGASSCSSCSRTGARCVFTRQPLKRGPSKGYIRELADRLNHLERQVHPEGELQEMHRMEIQRVQKDLAEQLMGGPRAGEKRTHAVSEALQEGPGHQNTDNSAPRASMVQPSPPGNTFTTPAPQPLSRSTPYFTSPAQQSQSQAKANQGDMQPFWRHGGNENRQESTALSYEAESSTTITNFDWDESVISEYYRIIHQTFPLLPNNKNRLRSKLADCPASLREAFLAALDCLMRTFPTTMLQLNANYAQALKKAGELLAKYPFDNPSTHTDATNLVYLQTLLLMALESDNHGPATIRGQAGPSRAEWLGRAAGVAGQLEINVIRTSSQSVMEGDRDSEERLARRVWWVLFILDRWHASSTADLLKLPENSVVLLPEDQILLGESTYHLARLSFIIGHLASILTTTKTPSTDVMAPSNPASSLLGLTLAGEIDRFRESVESVWGSLNLVHLSYHHCHLLIKRLSPTTEPTEMAGHAVKVATVLNSRLTPVTPLNHQFAALTAMTLCELCDVPATRAEALKGLDHMFEALGEGRGLAGKKESEGWDGAIRELVVKKRERMRDPEVVRLLGEVGMQGNNGQGGHEGFDPTILTRYGYLTALGQGRFTTG